MNELALFAGAGGGILGGKLLGWRTVCAVEWDAYARDVLVARQNDGCLEPFPIWNDVQTFDGRPWRGIVDVVSGGFPCQDISAAGKGAGIEGGRSGMWKHMARIIGEVLPHLVLVENSPMLVGRGLGMVLGDLAEMGYDAEWGVVGAHHAAAPHKRDRIWIIASANSTGDESPEKQPRQVCQLGGLGEYVADAEGISGWAGFSETATKCNGNQPTNGRGDVADTDDTGRKEQRSTVADGAEHETAECGSWWTTEPDVGRVAHGVAARVDRLRCIGNGQVPAVVRLAWETFKPIIKHDAARGAGRTKHQTT
jgi:DNA (cytosine-5)-methyltransferase 1